MNRESRLWLRTIVLLLLLLVASRTGSATAAPLLDDVVEVPCTLSAGLPLGQAIELTNNNSGHDIIRLEAGCTYGLFFAYSYVDGHNGLPAITDALTIEGNGARLERMTSIRFRLMQTAANFPLTIKDLTLANGYADDPNDTNPDGGAVYAVGDLTLENVTVVDNVAPGDGGGVYASGEATFENVTFTNNIARERGGGAFVENKASVTNSRFEGNESENAFGGGLIVLADLSLAQTDFVNNKASDGGGGVFVSGGHVDITGARFEGNTAFWGGGLDASDVSVTLVQSVFLNNLAASGAGVEFSLKPDTNNAFVNNLWVGNHYSYSDGATISVYLDFNTTLDILHNTLADPEDDDDKAIEVFNYESVVRVVNNIMASYATGLVSDEPGTTSGYNLYLISNPANAEVGSIEPFEGGDKLIALPGSQFVDAAAGDYRLKSTSPAIDRGFDMGVKADLDGITRPQINGYDLGAYEFVPAGIAPVAVDDAYSTSMDTPLTVPVPGVTENDTPGESGFLETILKSPPVNGTLNLHPDGNFAYTPNSGFIGEDSFTYVVSDLGFTSDEATVRIEVEGTVISPEAADDTYSVLQDTPLTVAAPGVLGNDSEGNGGSLTAVLESNPGNGTLSLNADGSFTYTPNGGFTGQDSFTYRAVDSQASSNIAIVTITVENDNRAPTANDDAYTTSGNTSLVIDSPGVLGNDSDDNGDSLITVLESNPSNGTLTLNDDGSFTYTPSNGFTGQDSFTYRASDGQVSSNVATVTITVENGNQAPTANNDTYTTPADTPLTVAAPGVLGNDSDDDGDDLTTVLESNPGNGTLTLNADGSFTYTPNNGFSGQDSFAYRVTDGQASSDVATVTITVENGNQAPTASDDAYTDSQNTSLVVATPGVLGNDSGDNGGSLTAVLESNPGNGTLSLNADGSFTYTPNGGFTGQDSFTYRAVDSQASSNVATVTITVENGNQAPAANDDTYTTPADAPLTVAAPGVLGNDSDGDGDDLTAVLESNPSNGTLTLNADGSFTYTPNNGFTGQDSFAYRAVDSQASSNIATVTITVENGNQAPTANNNAYTTPADTPLTVAAPGVLNNDSDPNSDPLTALLDSSPANGSVTIQTDGSFTYTPNAGFVGEDSFTYRASDGQELSNLATVNLQVQPLSPSPDDFTVFLPLVRR